MFVTAESRWFGRNSADESLLAWFQALPGRPEEHPTRIDRYLRLGGDESLGIKQREGRIEVKQRQEELGVESFQQTVQGRLEIWWKWSFVLAEGSPVVAGPERSWIEVVKTRQLRRYSLTAAGELETVPMGQFVDQGCGLELTRIESGGQNWWSLGLEAHGAPDMVTPILKGTATKIFSAPVLPSLEQENSYGYPRWLAQIG